MAAADYDVRIISHPLCPFAQRLALLLAAKGWRRGEEYRVTYLDLANLPAWFFDLSPEGNMPVLEVKGGAVTVDTDRAAQFLEEIAEPTLMPPTPLLRLHHREAIACVSTFLNRLKDVFVASDSAKLSVAIDNLFLALASSATVLGPHNGLYDGSFGTVDAAFAPFFLLATFFPLLAADERWHDTPTLLAWGRNLLTLPIVRATTCPDPAGEFQKFFAINRSAFADQVQAA